ncbi:MAG TPA: hypothetical protein VM221_10660 [Armatimonadota bacterium]|nr:hypothetical protein [Armatimonadota bacterium]
MDAEAERLIAGYAWAVETVVEVAAEGADDATTALARHAAEVFDLYREPLARTWGELTDAQRKLVADADARLLGADKDLWDAIGMRPSDILGQLPRASATLSKPSSRRKAADSQPEKEAAPPRKRASRRKADSD